MKPDDFGSVFDAGVDYLTVTTTEKKSRPRMVERALRLLKHEERSGYKLKPWTMSGFQGYSCGSMQVGEHDGRVLVRISGELAKAHWHSFGELHETCSRIDLQVTVRYECDAMHAIARTFRQAKRNKHEDGKARTVSLYQSSNGSATVYVGQRVTENYGRIYAKGLETKLPHWHNSVRFEAEFKGDQAATELRRLLPSSTPENDIVSRCRSFFSVRGCRPKWSYINLEQPAGHRDIKSGVNKLETTMRIPDAARRLLWLANSVRGPVADLIADGYRSEVLQALGLVAENLPAAHTLSAQMDQLVQKG